MEISLSKLLFVMGIMGVMGLAWTYGTYKKKGTKGLVVPLTVALLIPTMAVAISTVVKLNPSYELGAYPNEEKYYLGIEVTEDGKFTYINPSDFSTTTVDINIDDALIAGRINTIGLNNRYKKYSMLGPVKITWDEYEDMVMLSKFTAIQLGLMEATGAEDEQEFVIATGEAAEEFLESKARELEEADAATESTEEIAESTEEETNKTK